MFYVKQAAYRERKAKETQKESTEKKDVRKIRDRLRYVSNGKVPKIIEKIKALKDEMKKNYQRRKKKHVEVKTGAASCRYEGDED